MKLIDQIMVNGTNEMLQRIVLNGDAPTVHHFEYLTIIVGSWFTIFVTIFDTNLMVNSC